MKVGTKIHCPHISFLIQKRYLAKSMLATKPPNSTNNRFNESNFLRLSALKHLGKIMIEKQPPGLFPGFVVTCQLF